LSTGSGQAWQVATLVDRDLRRPGGTIRDRAARELRERILVGDLPAGTRIDLDKIAEEFGTSRTPVREACLQLEHEGLVDVAPRSGVTVIGVSSSDTVENFAIMAALSGLAAAWAAQRITEQELETVKLLRANVVIAAEQGGDIAAANWAFHREINRACRSPRLLRLLANTGLMIPLRFFELFPEQIPCSLTEHDALLDALRDGDHVSARQLTETHFAASGRLLAEHLKVAHRSSV
jgi:DNA-binding GntR family transcriptional regulator